MGFTLAAVVRLLLPQSFARSFRKKFTFRCDKNHINFVDVEYYEDCKQGYDTYHAFEKTFAVDHPDAGSFGDRLKAISEAMPISGQLNISKELRDIIAQEIISLSDEHVTELVYAFHIYGENFLMIVDGKEIGMAFHIRKIFDEIVNSREHPQLERGRNFRAVGMMLERYDRVYGVYSEEVFVKFLLHEKQNPKPRWFDPYDMYPRQEMEDFDNWWEKKEFPEWGTPFPPFHVGTALVSVGNTDSTGWEDFTEELKQKHARRGDFMNLVGTNVKLIGLETENSDVNGSFGVIVGEYDFEKERHAVQVNGNETVMLVKLENLEIIADQSSDDEPFSKRRRIC